jgi:hypothetical protein
MNPGTGRFVSCDTFPGVLRNPITLNGFIYANDSPANAVDPSGHFVEGLISGLLDIAASGLENGAEITTAKWIIDFVELSVFAAIVSSQIVAYNSLGYYDSPGFLGRHARFGPTLDIPVNKSWYVKKASIRSYSQPAKDASMNWGTVDEILAVSLQVGPKGQPKPMWRIGASYSFGTGQWTIDGGFNVEFFPRNTVLSKIFKAELAVRLGVAGGGSSSTHGRGGLGVEFTVFSGPKFVLSLSTDDINTLA